MAPIETAHGADIAGAAAWPAEQHTDHTDHARDDDQDKHADQQFKKQGQAGPSDQERQCVACERQTQESQVDGGQHGSILAAALGVKGDRKTGDASPHGQGRRSIRHLSIVYSTVAETSAEGSLMDRPSDLRTHPCRRGARIA
ncbi:hypothetical protein ACVMFA_002540 [Bradyrhizobium liaoningense]